MRKSILILVCPLVALAGVIGASRESQGAMTWSLADDFSYTQNSDTSTWSYRLDDNAGTYSLLTANTRNANEIWGTTFASPPLMWSESTNPGEYWGVGKNLSGVTQTSAFGVNWAPDEVLFHPKNALPGRMVFSWLAPKDMVVDVGYTFGSAMSAGNGVGYSILQRSSGPDHVLIDWGQGDSYIGQPGSVSRSLHGVSVKAGDRLYFRFDNWADAGGDITRAAINVSEVPTPQWSLARDFSYAENGDTSTWSYRRDDNSGNYPLLTVNTRNANNLWGSTFADPPQMWSDATGYWGVGVNLSGATQSSAPGVNWAPDEVLFHPEGDVPGRMVFSWLSPRDMTIDVRYLFGHAMDAGNGIGYSIVLRSGATDTVLVDWGQGDSYIGRPGLASDLLKLEVKAGDRLFFRFDNWGDAGGDVSRAAIFISEVPEPSSMALCVLGLVGLLVCGRRRRG